MKIELNMSNKCLRPIFEKGKKYKPDFQVKPF